MTGDSVLAGFRERLLRNLTLQVASQLIGIVISVVTLAILARTLEIEAFGGYNFLFTFIVFFLSFNDLGIPTTLLREITQMPARTEALVQSIIGLRLVMAFLSIVIGWAVVSWLNLPPAYRLPQLVYLLILPVQAFATPLVILQSRIHMSRMVVVELANRLCGFVLMLIAIAMGGGLLWIAVSLVLGEVAGTLVVVMSTWRAAPPIPRFDTAIWRQVVRMSLPLSGTSLLVVLLNRIDMVLVQKLAPSPEIGLARVSYYGSAYRIPNLCERVPQMMMGTIFPAMISLAATDIAALRRLYRQTLMHLSLLALPMAMAVTLVAPYLVRVWIGEQYMPAVPLMRVLIWASALLYVALPPANLLIALRHQHINFWLMVPATLVNIALNLFWIPAYGAIGAAWATVASYGFLTIGYLIAVPFVLPKAAASRPGAVTA